MMNTSFDSFRLVNTYGAFGSVGKERPELIFLFIVLCALRTILYQLVLMCTRVFLSSLMTIMSANSSFLSRWHTETQPIPNPLSWYFHMIPSSFQRLSTLVNHIVELPAPFFLLLSRRPRIVGGVVQILFQFLIILSGNLSFLNYLTILPAIWCFDDAALE